MKDCSNYTVVIIGLTILSFVLWIQWYYFQQRYKYLKNRQFPEAIVIEEP